jgi:uncharacterized protein (TIGR00251 family)
VVEYTEDESRLTFAVKVITRASKSEIAGEYNRALRIRLAAPPVDGAANRELIRLLAKNLKVPQNAVEIISGAASKHKIIRVQGVSGAALEHLIRKE